MRGVIAAVVLLMMTGAAPVVAQENIAGTWNGTFTRGTGREEFTMVITQDGEAVKGTLSSKVVTGGSVRSANVGRERENTKVEGTFVGNQLNLKIGKQDSIVGTISGDQLTGQAVSGNNPPRVVSATRAK
jgi:hypothetical protein